MTPDRRTRLHRRLTIVAVSLLAFVLTLAATWGNTPTVDEYAHLPAGIDYWRTGDFSLYNLNPPLGKLLAAVPVMMLSPRFPSTRAFSVGPLYLPPREDPWFFGDGFSSENKDEYDRLFFWGRVPIALCGAITVGLVCWFSWNLFGWLGGTVSGVAAALSPNLLAHSGLVTPDIPLTLFWLLTLIGFYQVVRRRSWVWAVLTGLFLAAVLLTKYSALVLLIAAPFAALVATWVHGETRKTTCQIVLAAVLAMILVTSFYTATGNVGSPRLSFRSDWMSWLRRLPLPFPKAYLGGLDAQLVNVEQGEFGNYLNGQWYQRGRWHYFPEAFLLKVPLPVLILAGLALVGGWKSLRRPGPAFWILLIPAVLFLLVNMFLSSLNIGLRYLLPIFPAVFIGLGAVGLLMKRTKVFAVIGSVLLVALAVEAALTFPHYLAYFNPIAGGSVGGPRYLLDSNIDWGQDLKRLADYVERHNIKDLRLAYFGHVEPKRYGISARRPLQGASGWVAVSVNYVYGMGYGGFRRGELTWLQKHEPVARIGGSIYVYHLDGPQ